MCCRLYIEVLLSLCGLGGNSVLLVGRSALLSLPEIKVAFGATPRRNDVKRITSSGGQTVAAPTSTTYALSVPNATPSCTTTAGRLMLTSALAVALAVMLTSAVIKTYTNTNSGRHLTHSNFSKPRSCHTSDFDVA